jgi:hypothetical protein
MNKISSFHKVVGSYFVSPKFPGAYKTFQNPSYTTNKRVQQQIVIYIIQKQKEELIVHRYITNTFPKRSSWLVMLFVLWVMIASCP